MSKDNLATLLTLNECKEIVKKFNEETKQNLQVINFHIKPATEAKGFLGEYFHLTIDCFRQDQDRIELTVDDSNDREDPNAAIFLRFFIKNLPIVDEGNERVSIFRKESALYGSLLPKLQKYAPEPWYPKIYLCQQNLLVLEDLENLGFRSLTSKENLNENEMRPILKALAAMHASSLLYEQETQENINETYKESLKEITVHPDIPWFTTGLKALIEVAKNHSKYQSATLQNCIIKELPGHLKQVYSMVNSSTKYRNVLCHRDTWGGNIFVNPLDLERSAVFVDFQTCRYCPPAIDVIFTLFMNLTKQERLSKESGYLSYYYGQLRYYISSQISKANLEKENLLFSEFEFLESIKEFKLLGLVYRALAITVLKVPKEMVSDFYKNEERSQKLLEYMKENKEFRLIMEESVEDIMEAIGDISLR